MCAIFSISRGVLLLLTVLAEWGIMTNRAYVKNNGDGFLCSILWFNPPWNQIFNINTSHNVYFFNQLNHIILCEMFLQIFQLSWSLENKIYLPVYRKIIRVQCGIIFYHVCFTCAKYFAFCRSRIFVSWDIVANLRYIIYIRRMLFIECLRRATNNTGMGRA
jgi:hypothetical protein